MCSKFAITSLIINRCNHKQQHNAATDAVADAIADAVADAAANTDAREAQATQERFL